MSGSDWFEKMGDAERIQYCSDHPRSKICKVFFGGKTGVEKKTEPKALGPSSVYSGDDSGASSPKKTEAPKSAPVSKDEAYYDTGKDYEWARKSGVQNLGEDVKGSARHGRNAHRDWGTLQEMALNEDFNKKQLLSLYEPNPESIPDKFAPAYYVIRDILRTYPEFNAKESTMENYNVRPENKVVVSKEQWIATYEELWEAGKQIAEAERNPIAVASKFRAYLEGMRAGQGNALRNPMFGDFNTYARYGATDNKNGTIQKFLRPFLNNLSEREIMKISQGRDEELVKRVFSQLEGDDFCQKMKKVLLGEPMSSAFGVESKEKESSYSPADLYKKVIKVREGGREILNYDQCATFFMEEMGARAVQYGNSLNDAQRFFHAKTTAEAMSDMAHALDIPVKSLSLDGRFAIGFGSRGTKGSLATYHPTYEILNMNKDAEYGALAHEFGHAIGYRLSSIALSKIENLPKRKYCVSELLETHVRATPFGEFQRKFKIINRKILNRVSKEESFKKAGMKERKWAMDTVEGFARGWESYVARKLEKKGMKNTYLVAGFESYQWPTQSELDELEPVFDELLETYFRK